MTAIPGSPLFGALSLGEQVSSSIHRRESSDILKVHGLTALSWTLKPEVEWYPRERCRAKRFCSFHLVVRAAGGSNVPQNVDLPRVAPRKKKRPSAVPKQRSKRRWTPVQHDPARRPPGNGLLVEHLIPVAHEVMEAKAVLTKGVELVLKEIPVRACRFCPEIHVGSNGHNLRTCVGSQSAARNSLHDWLKGNIYDILVPVEAYHLADRLAPPISHDQRFEVERISAVEELCIQAGVDVPERPTRRYVEPVQPPARKHKEDVSWKNSEEITYYTAQGSYQLPKSVKQGQQGFRSRPVTEGFTDDHGYSSGGHKEEALVLEETEEPHRSNEQSTSAIKGDIMPVADICPDDNLETIARKTLQAWDIMRDGAKTLMAKYRVVACGYCPEVHVGPRGHRARACGAFKHQWRDGKHGWQEASIDEFIPPQYVWHLRDRFGPPLENALRSFYGKAPAVVELCVHAGAPVPDRYLPVMRLDVAIPTLAEYENVI